MLQSQSSTELDVKEETTSPLPVTAAGDVTVKAESDNGSATPTSTGRILYSTFGPKSLTSYCAVGFLTVFFLDL